MNKNLKYYFVTAIAAIAFLLPSCTDFEPTEQANFKAESEENTLTVESNPSYYYNADKNNTRFLVWLKGENGRHLSFTIDEPALTPISSMLGVNTTVTPEDIRYDIPYSSNSRDYSMVESYTGTMKVISNSKHFAYIDFDNFVFTYNDANDKPHTVKLNGKLKFNYTYTRN